MFGRLFDPLRLVTVPVVPVYIGGIGLWTKKRFSRLADGLARNKPTD